MTTLSQNADNGSIILTTGMFDLLKDQIRRKKMSPFNEAKIVEQLKNAKQVLRSQLPATIVDVNTKVNLTDLESNQNITYIFVAPERARSKNNTESILSPIGLALIGYPEGAEVPWEMPDGIRRYRIDQVSRM
ncbi:MAG: transcription elongation factor GreAB [Pedobacter sp.]|nr:MAG: transcription elongation factor GreAB [Pedobacter sp.]